MKQVHITHRIGNLEVRNYLQQDDKFEIVKWNKNESYHSYNYEWDECKQMYKYKQSDCVYISKASYEAEEYCFVISFFDVKDNSLHERKICRRYRDLNDDEKHIFNQLVEELYINIEGDDTDDCDENYVENPIIDGRMVNDKTFATRLKNFVSNTMVNDLANEEELEYLKIVADKLLAYQKSTATSQEEIQYFKNLEK